MSKLIKMKCDDTEILVEVEDTEEEIPRRVSVEEPIKKVLISFEEVSNTIKAYCGSLVKTFKSMDKELIPHKVGVEFGIKISGEGNVYIVKSSAEASLKIIAEWFNK